MTSVVLDLTLLSVCYCKKIGYESIWFPGTSNSPSNVWIRPVGFIAPTVRVTGWRITSMTSRAQEFPDSQFRSGRCGEIERKWHAYKICSPAKKYCKSYTHVKYSHIGKTQLPRFLYKCSYMDRIHVPLRHKYPALKTLPKKNGLGRPMDTHHKNNGGTSKWSLVKKEPLYTHHVYSCILIFAGPMLICESMSIKEPFQVPGSVSGYQAPPTETKVCKNCVNMIYIYISLYTCFKQWFRRWLFPLWSWVLFIICSHFSGGSTKINMARCNPASNPTSHQEFNPMIQTASSVILLRITIKSCKSSTIIVLTGKAWKFLAAYQNDHSLCAVLNFGWNLFRPYGEGFPKNACNAAEYLQAVWTYPYNHVFMQTVDVFVRTCDV